MARAPKAKATKTAITPKGLEALGMELWGNDWRKKFMEEFEVSYSQMHRYMTVYRGTPIPRIIVLALEAKRIAQEMGFEINIDRYEADIADAEPVKLPHGGYFPGNRDRVFDGTPIIDLFGESDMPEADPEEPEGQTVEESVNDKMTDLANALQAKTVSEEPAPQAVKKPASKPAKAKPATTTQAAKKPASKPAKAKEKPASQTAKRPAPKRRVMEQS